jgi:hypothetical protein
MWNDVIQGRQEGLMDPYGLYRQWFEGMESVRDTVMGGTGSANPMNFMGGANPMAAMMGAMSPGSNPMASLMSDPIAGLMNSPFNPMTAMMGTLAGTNGTGGSPQMPVAGVDPGDAWRKWFEATSEAWQKSADFGSEVIGVTPRWMQMIAQSRDNMMAAQNFPKDPLEFAVQWYNATSGPLSEFVQDVIEREEFLAQSSRFMRNYASLYKIFSRNSEQYFRFFQLPVRSDITRVAQLVIGLEDKVDRLEEAFEDFEYGYAQPATAEAVGSLDNRLTNIQRKLNDNARAVDEAVGSLDNRLTSVQRRLTESANSAAESAAGVASADAVDGLASRVDRVEGKIDRVESKLDQLLSALENSSRNGGATAAEVATDDGAGEAQEDLQPEATEVQATDAARRKAAELGVDLTTVEGTGSGGQITVGDVRKKGDS